MEAGHVPASDRMLDIVALTTAEMLAVLPESLMIPHGASAAERRLTDVLTLYRAVFLNAREPIAIIDSAGRYLEQNAAHEQLTGFTSLELEGKTPAIHLGADTFQRIAGELQRTGFFRDEVESRTKHGMTRVLDLSAFAIRDRAGNPVCYVGITRDVTGERHAARELQQRFEELQAVYRTSDALSRAGSLEEMYEDALTGLLQALHADRASVLLTDDAGVMRFKAWKGLSDAYRAAVEGHSPWTRDTLDPQPVTVADVLGDPHYAGLAPAITREGIRSLAFIPLTDETGLLGKFMVYFDAPHVWSDEELRISRTIARHVSFAIARHRRDQELQDANRAKSVFLATMSHELRTPLNAIAGYTDLLDAGVHGMLTDKQRDALQRVQANQRHLLQLIDDVLDFAKLDAGRIQLEISNVPVQETLDATRALVDPQVEAKNLTLEFVPGDPQVTCRADRARVQQILANLVSNARKFTPPGGTITVGWTATPDAVRASIRDTGPGIATQHHEKIFEPFVQLPPGMGRITEGVGLGLAISRELARRMGGDLTVESDVGQGATFTLSLPR
jgi:PAS domain S-box-containing protein